MTAYAVDVKMAGKIPVPAGVPWVRVVDTTIREGKSAPELPFSPEDAAAVATQLDAIGIDTIEAGFPAASPDAFAAVRAVASVVRQAEVKATVRALSEMDRAAEALEPARRPVIDIVCGVSDDRFERGGMSRAEGLRWIERTLGHARGKVPQLQFTLEDATRTDRLFMRQVVETAVRSGAARIGIADTTGCAVPEEFGACIADAVQICDGRAIVSAQCRNDRGTALANAVAAVQCGARQVEATVNGAGEPAGLLSLDAFATACLMKGLARTNLRLERLQQIAFAANSV